MSAAPGSIVEKLGTLLLRLGLGFLILSALLVLSLRWLDPPTSSFMIQHWISGWIDGRESPYLHHEWVDWAEIAPAVPLAVVAAEDQRFPDHRGFDLVEIVKAWEKFRAGGKLRGASTISQQVAKNLFLWKNKDLVRKCLEAWLTWVIERTWSKQRILEVYLNTAQLGPDTFGVGAAGLRFFDRRAAALSARDAARLAAVLPSPDRYRLDAPSGYLNKRAAWVRKQMRQLGAGYLDKL
jgi:monofunctional biosynthetic peptidoglycan transglycosylase